MINLISKQGKFNNNVKELGNKRSTISIFGSQSSGKSTLLNEAFQTHFPVLDLREGRHRCTLGVMLQNTQDFTIIDNQGFDSADRQEEEKIFEKQIALFSLAICDVIIINIWMNEIGREVGSQSHIIKSIFKVCSRLTNKVNKTIIFTVQKCSVDANRAILREAIENNFKRILEEQKKVQGNNFGIKFEIKCAFFSNFDKMHEKYKEQASLLKEMIKTKQSFLNSYNPRDKITFLSNIWNKILSPEIQIDLKAQDDAFKLYICQTNKNQIINHLIIDIKQIYKLGHYKSYQKWEHSTKRSIKLKFNQVQPRNCSENMVQSIINQLSEEVVNICSTHFVTHILPNEQSLLIKTIIAPMQSQTNTYSLDKIIINKKKQALEGHKNIVLGHRDSQLLTKKFQDTLNFQCLPFERQSRIIFNVFEAKLQSELNNELDLQIAKLEFNRDRIIKSIKKICKQFQYNDWQVNLNDTWDKIIHRALHMKLPQKIQHYSSMKTGSIWNGELEEEISLYHKQLEKKIEKFLNGLLKFYDQDADILHQMDRLKEKIWQCNIHSLEKEHKRFKISLLTVIILMFLMYGQFTIFLKMFSVGKSKRKYLGYLYMASIIGIIGLQIYRKSPLNTKNNKKSQ